jgi:hypothetical protein
MPILGFIVGPFGERDFLRCASEAENGCRSTSRGALNVDCKRGYSRSPGNRSIATVVCWDRSAYKSRFGVSGMYRRHQGRWRFNRFHIERLVRWSVTGGQSANQIPNPIFLPMLQVTPPPRVATPETCRSRCCSNAGRQGTSWNPRPSSIMAKRPDASVTR